MPENSPTTQFQATSIFLDIIVVSNLFSFAITKGTGQLKQQIYFLIVLQTGVQDQGVARVFSTEASLVGLQRGHLLSSLGLSSAYVPESKQAVEFLTLSYKDASPGRLGTHPMI